MNTTPRQGAPTGTEAARQTTERFDRPIFPASGFKFNPEGKAGEGALLHHALLRSPEPGPKALPDGFPKLYSFVQHFALGPVELGTVAYQEITFALPSGSCLRIPPTQPPSKLGGEYSRLLVQGSLLYRLRCVVSKDSSCGDSSAWLAAACSWPTELSFAVNKKVCEPRRVPQYKKNMPLDISHFVVDGPNILSVALTSRIVPDTKVAVAVEGIHTVTHENIMTAIKQRSYADVLATIQKSISSDSTGDDELRVLPSGRRNISLLDPYSSCTTCKIPVRGIDCKHFECFDLETFLSQQERRNPGYPSIVDGWRCPICKGDARPHMILKDGFHLQVREELMRNEQIDVRAITVEPDGTWRPVLPPQTGSAECLKHDMSRSGKANAPKKVVEVIELD